MLNLFVNGNILYRYLASDSTHISNADVSLVTKYYEKILLNLIYNLRISIISLLIKNSIKVLYIFEIYKI